MRPASRILQVPDWGIREILLWLFVAQFGAITIFVLVTGLAYGSEGLPDERPIWVLVASVLGLWIGYGYGPIREVVSRGLGIDSELGLKARWREYGFGLAAGVATQLLVLPALYFPILKIFPDSDVGAAAEELVADFDTFGERLIFILVAVVAAPLVEELFYRGLMLRGLTRYLPLWLAAVASSALFAAIHFQLLQLPGLFVFGLVAAALVIFTGKVGVAIAMHVGFNLTTVIALFS